MFIKLVFAAGQSVCCAQQTRFVIVLVRNTTRVLGYVQPNAILSKYFFVGLCARVFKSFLANSINKQVCKRGNTYVHIITPLPAADPKVRARLVIMYHHVCNFISLFTDLTLVRLPTLKRGRHNDHAKSNTLQTKRNLSTTRKVVIKTYVWHLMPLRARICNALSKL